MAVKPTGDLQLTHKQGDVIVITNFISYQWHREADYLWHAHTQKDSLLHTAGGRKEKNTIPNNEN